MEYMLQELDFETGAWEDLMVVNHILTNGEWFYIIAISGIPVYSRMNIKYMRCVAIS